MFNKILIFFLLLSTISSSILYSKSTAGGGSYLNYPLGAKEIACGGAYYSLADGAFVQSWNPAGISIIDIPLIGLGFNYVDQKRYVGGLSYVPKAQIDRINWAVMTKGVYYSGIQKYDSSGDKTGKDMFSSNSLDFGLSTNILNDILFVGANIRILHEDLIDKSANGGALDLGYIFKLPYLQFGMVLYNLPNIEKSKSQESYYTTDSFLKTSVSYSESGIIIALGIKKCITSDDDTKWNIGSSFTIYHLDKKPYDNNILLNCGFYEGAFTCGATLQYYSFKFDYALKLPSKLEKYISNYFSLSYSYE